MKLFTATVLILLSFGHTLSRQSAYCQDSKLGLFEKHGDIGAVRKPGSVTYNSKKQEYVIEGSGTNMWGGQDEFHFVWKRMKGNFILTTKASSSVKELKPIGKSDGQCAQVLIQTLRMLMLRCMAMALHLCSSGELKRGATEEVKSQLKGADVIELERKGNTYRMSVARFGEDFVTEQVSDLTLGDEVYVGLYVCSHNKDVMEKAVFRDVRITVPVKDDFVPYRDYIGSNLEILDVESGSRTIVYSSPESLQAPNWTTDGKALIYNSGGRLYRFDLAKEKAVILNTDFATGNNNDHVLSFDGKMIGISHHSKEDQNKSIIYVLPVYGSKPRRVTSKGPSYLHGWSPDGKFLIYTGERNGEFDIYKVSAEGGEETRLTDAKGLDDGSEYTPDGKYIYFNSNRTGSMQIWRMKPDGSNQEQVTSDQYNNWFPHISPDGKWIIFLSFSKEVDSGDHPFYKKVYLRLMPFGGGKPKIIAYVYGGQGTINVPSWSPDSKKVAFVSNTDMK